MEAITVKRVRSERRIYEQCSGILLNWRYIRGTFGYKTLCEFDIGCKICIGGE